ncbi:MAG: hypothetical protein ING19_06585 [Azospirillum sp.]|nr:hypothetical protein [Azospirillum sp.]
MRKKIGGISKGAPEFLFHGTSWISALMILRCGHFDAAHLSTSSDADVSAIWAARAAEYEIEAFGLGIDEILQINRIASAGVVFRFRTERLSSVPGIDLRRWSDPVFGPGVCDWEKEWRCRVRPTDRGAAWRLPIETVDAALFDAGAIFPICMKASEMARDPKIMALANRSEWENWRQATLPAALPSNESDASRSSSLGMR